MPKSKPAPTAARNFTALAILLGALGAGLYATNRTTRPVASPASPADTAPADTAPVYQVAPFYRDGRMVQPVYDGDTFWAIGPLDSRLKVRLAGADAPELGQPLGKDARDWLAGKLSDSRIRVITGSGSFDRTVADVYAGKLWINREILRCGYAMLDRRFDNRPELVAAESSARADRRGVWSDDGSIPPWEWRRGKREQTSGESP